MEQRIIASNYRVIDPELAALTEDVIFLVKQSCAIQLARVDAFLDGAVLAAEQVQDIRLKNLESPPPVSGWEYWGNVLLTFALESAVLGPLLGAMTKQIFRRILKQHVIFLALPKGPDGQALKLEARALGRAAAERARRGGATRFQAFRKGAEQRAEAVKKALEKGLQYELPTSPQGRGREIQRYHGALEDLVRNTSDSQENLVAAAQAARDALQRPSPTPPPTFGASDSAGVSLIGAAQNYAALTRLGIRVRHARIEQLIRGQNFVPEYLALAIDAFGWEDLQLDVYGQRISPNLSDIRSRYRIAFEALIWARLYGFDMERNVPRVVGDNGFFGPRVEPAISDYWLARFADVVDTLNRSPGPLRGRYIYVPESSFKQQPKWIQLRALQQYFWDVVRDLRRSGTQLREGELTQRVVPDPGE